MTQDDVLTLLRDGGGGMRNLALLAKCWHSPTPHLARLEAKGLIRRELTEDRLETVWVVVQKTAAGAALVLVCGAITLLSGCEQLTGIRPAAIVCQHADSVHIDIWPDSVPANDTLVVHLRRGGCR